MDGDGSSESSAPEDDDVVRKLRPPSPVRWLILLCSVSAFSLLVWRASPANAPADESEVAGALESEVRPLEGRWRRSSDTRALGGTKAFAIQGPAQEDAAARLSDQPVKPGKGRFGLVPLGGSKSDPQAVRRAARAAPEDPMSSMNALMASDYLGSSKSGFGGLGLRGTGKPEGEAFLGGSKAGILSTLRAIRLARQDAGMPDAGDAP